MFLNNTVYKSGHAYWMNGTKVGKRKGRTPALSQICAKCFSPVLLLVAWFSLCLMGVSAPAVLGYIGERCQGVSSDTDTERKKYHAVQRRDLHTVHLTKQEAMLEVKGL